MQAHGGGFEFQTCWKGTWQHMHQSKQHSSICTRDRADDKSAQGTEEVHSCSARACAASLCYRCKLVGHCSAQQQASRQQSNLAIQGNAGCPCDQPRRSKRPRNGEAVATRPTPLDAATPGSPQPQLCRMCSTQNLSPPKVHGVFSDVLYQQHVCATAPFDPDWFDSDTLLRRAHLAPHEFREQFEHRGRPVVVGVTKEFRSAMERWSWDGLAQALQGKHIIAGAPQRFVTL